jgi:hypothetical protein
LTFGFWILVFGLVLTGCKEGDLPEFLIRPPTISLTQQASFLPVGADKLFIPSTGKSLL